jgi:thiol-disulfide isomerase/thioredoxin
MRTLFLVIVFAVTAAACTPSPDAGKGEGQDVEDRELTTTSTTATVTSTPYDGPSYAGTVDAPAFPEGLEWINTPEPISMNDLKGKVVLLDFWTYGCINCIHIIPDLERLESEYPEELVVIGVHSAKFPNEGRTENLVDIVQRYGIRHPVVNDKDFAIWNAWGANAWPTVALVDPTGRVVGTRAGEGVYDAVQPVIAGLVAEFDAQQAINRDPITVAPAIDAAPDRPLSYPGKVLATPGALWITDTGHNRIVEVDPSTGNVVSVFGSGDRGADDGVALEASFNAPQGLALGDGVLYVADTNNHLIRAIDLDGGTVTTVAGTGEQGWPPRFGRATSIALSNPWDLVFDAGKLYIANAGTHQIWVMDIAERTVGPLVGSAAEGTGNGSFDAAALAQPSGLALGDGKLYFADSESSSIRVADLEREETSLVVGGDANLFDFGDVDGQGNAARLQHPLGVAIDGDMLYVADTYNSKIKRVTVSSGTVTTWLGEDAGWADGSAPLFNEPGGLSIADGLLYVADTNNHAIRVVDRRSGETSTLVLKGIEAFDPPSEFAGEVVRLDPVTAAAGPATLTLDYVLPDGYEVNDEAPSSVVVGSGSVLVRFTDPKRRDITGTMLPVSIPISLSKGSGTTTFDVTIIYCAEESPDLCLIDRVRFEQPIEVGQGGASGMIVLPRTIANPNL